MHNLVGEQPAWILGKSRRPMSLAHASPCGRSKIAKKNGSPREPFSRSRPAAPAVSASSCATRATSAVELPGHLGGLARRQARRDDRPARSHFAWRSPVAPDAASVARASGLTATTSLARVSMPTKRSGLSKNAPLATLWRSSARSWAAPGRDMRTL